MNFDYINMIHHFKNFSLPKHQLYIIRISHLISINYFNGTFFLSQTMYPQHHLSEASLPQFSHDLILIHCLIGIELLSIFLNIK